MKRTPSTSPLLHDTDHPLANLLQWLLLLTIAIAGVAGAYLLVAGYALYEHVPDFSRQLLLLLGGAAGAAALGLVCHRIGWLRAAARILVAIFSFGTWAAVAIVGTDPLISQQTVRLVISFVVLSVLASSIFLSLRETIVLALLHQGALLVHDLSSSDISYLVDTVNSTLFLLISSAFICCIAFVRARNEALIARQRQALLEREILFQAVLDNATTLIYLKDSSGRYLAVNRGYAALTALRPVEFIGRSAHTVLPQPWALAEAARDREVLQRQVASENEETIHISGAERTYLALRFPLYTLDGSLYGVGNIATDITERQRARAALEDANRRLSAGVTALEQRDLTMMLLNELGDLLQLCRSLDEAYTLLARFVPRLLPGSNGGIYLMPPSRNQLALVVGWGEGEQLEETSFAPEQCWAIRRARPVLSGDAAGLSCEHHRATQLSSLCVPLLSQGEALGILYVVGPCEERFSTEQQQITTMLADTIALGLTTLRLYETLRLQSIRDGLTGLYNRRYLEEALDHELRRAAQKHQTLCVMMLDLDHFKRFNDSFGHSAGDMLLQSLGRLLLEHGRDTDLRCRYGGEEFTLILPDTELDEALVQAERLRERVRQLLIEYRGQPLGLVTLSVGVAAYPQHGSDPQGLIERADRALYAAKRQGRDRVMVAGAELEPAGAVREALPH